MWRVAAVAMLFGLVMFLGAGSSEAFSSELPPSVELPRRDPPGKWRYLGQDQSTTTSTCIGSVATPLCTAETELASGLREDIALRRIALDNRGDESDYEFSGTPPWPWHSIKYRIVRAYRMKLVDIPKWARHPIDPNDEAWEPWDVRIDIQHYDCDTRLSPGQSMCQPAPTVRIYVLRAIPQGWRVISAFVNADPIASGYLPGL